MIEDIYGNFPSGRQLARVIFVEFTVSCVTFDIPTCIETREVRRATPEQLSKLPPETTFFVLSSDPHHAFLRSWLTHGDDRKILTIGPSDIPIVLQRLRSEPFALVLGPTGHSSGKSILKHCCWDDFSFTFPQDMERTPSLIQKLPYYAHYPLFMMEEGNSQYFYFRNQVPPLDKEQSKPTLYFWSLSRDDKIKEF